jgi:hypothetical protein
MPSVETMLTSNSSLTLPMIERHLDEAKKLPAGPPST